MDSKRIFVAAEKNFQAVFESGNSFNLKIVAI